MTRGTAKLLCGAILLAGVGCGSPTLRPVAPEVRTVDVPAVGQQATAALGDTLLDVRQSTLTDALVLDGRVAGGNLLLLERYGIAPGTLVARDDTDDGRLYYADAISATDFFDDWTDVGGIKVSPDGQRYWLFRGRDAHDWPIRAPAVRRTTVTTTGRPARHRQLIYAGHAGSVVRFTYREWDAGVERTAEARDLQFDLAEGPDVAFRGARLTILAATNAGVTYVVRTPFPR